jgi:excisionase family DNA binding protein
MERLTVREAAERLAISEEAVRKRVQRGTLPHAKPSDGHVYVFLDSNASVVNQTLEEESAKQATLHYIDKLYSAWKAIDAQHRRFIFLQVLIAVLLLALSGGAVSTEENLTMSGIELKVPLVVLMTTGAVLITFLNIMSGSLARLMQPYIDEIRRLYQIMGLDYATIYSAANPFTSGSAGQALYYMFARENPTLADGTRPPGVPPVSTPIGAPLVGALALIIPTAAQVAAGYKVSEFLDKPGSGWFLYSFFILALITGVATFLTVISTSTYLRYLAYLLESPRLEPSSERPAVEGRIILRRIFPEQYFQEGLADLRRFPKGVILTIAKVSILAVTLIYVYLGAQLGYFVVKVLPAL